MTRLAEAPFIAALQQLHLGDNELDDDGLELLLRGVRPGALRWLSLSGNPLSDEAVLAISRAPQLAGLEALELDVSDDVSAEFSRSPVLQRTVIACALGGTIPPGAGETRA